VGQATGGRRGQSENSIYWDSSKNRYVGAVSQGSVPGGRRIRRKVTGRTKAEVRDKLGELHLAAGYLWQDHNLVFASTIGTPLDDHNVRQLFRKISESAGLGSMWVPRELRHTFVSLLSARGVPVEAIALLAGHNQTATAELIYRYQIVPALTRGAEVMDQIFG
jgi:integrase